MLKTKNNFTEFGEITNWGNGGSLERYKIEPDDNTISDSEFTVEELAKLGLEVGDVVVTGFVSANEQDGITFVIAQADLERDTEKEEAWDKKYFEAHQQGKEALTKFREENPEDYGVDTVDLENVIDSSMCDYDMEQVVEKWIRDNCKHFIINNF